MCMSQRATLQYAAGGSSVADGQDLTSDCIAQNGRHADVSWKGKWTA